MNVKTAVIEEKIALFIENHPDEWKIVCGLKFAQYDELLKVLGLLRAGGLYELEGMLIWKMEHITIGP